MPAKDLYHDSVKAALTKDGWIITKESLTFMVGKRPAIIDLAAEKILIAEKGAQKIAVEVKSFVSPSPMSDLEKALGQFFLYSDILSEREPDRILYLAISEAIHSSFFSEEIGKLLSRRRPELKFIIFNPDLQEIIQWKPYP
jgi:XisH protein